MYQKLEHQLSKLQNTDIASLLKERKIGIEKECLRVNKQGKISQTPHPLSLGSALTNPYITTDYSEALLELITPPFHSIPQVLDFLRDTQKFVYTRLQDEILWCTSMPCVLAGEESIPIAQYGSSNSGMMKTVYRRGLGHRYGRMMQVIAGIHYNYSLPKTFWSEYQLLEQDTRSQQDFISDSYFKLIRNLQRFGWLVPYLFGASPAVCRSFMDGIEKVLEPFDEFTFHHPYATSLRLSDIGYQNYKEGKSGIKVNYDSLSSYIKCLRRAIETPSPEYVKHGIKTSDGYQQLNANLLQIENEYYSTVRPKQITGTYEKPTVALAKRGVEYIELRSLDVNVFEPLGVSESQMYFLDAFLMFCLLHDSPVISAGELKEIDHNQSSSAHHGREPGLKLQRNGKPVLLCAWATELFNAMSGVCRLMDRTQANAPYTAALKTYYQMVEDPDLTPSAKILQQMKESGDSFFPYSKRHAEQHARHFQSLPISDEQLRFFREAAEASIAKQRKMEADDTLDFDDFLQRYFAETLETDQEHMHL
ncbi:MAG: glutamate--cysteine ligase [Gammaproteobacteria bacterium]|nr:glutamate--cysteine ligase [Gammaproteobacteria bacterium]